MPVEEHDPFEDRFASALRQAGGAFETDQHGLVTGGAARGRRLRRRRAAVAGGVAAVALVGLGAPLVLPGGGTGGGRERSVAAAPSTPAASPTAPAAMSADDLIRTLEKLLPKGRFSNEQGRGTHQDPGPYVQVVYDDGKGKSAIAVSLGRVQPGGQDARQSTECPDKVYIPYDACVTRTLPDGSKFMVLQGYEYPDRRVDTKLWTAELVTPKGQHVSVQEWNAAAEKGAPVSRDEPPLSPAQLQTLATAPEWRAAIDATPVDPRVSTAPEPSAPQGVPGGSVSSTLASLVPKGIKVVSKSGADPEFGYVVLDDGRGASLVQVNDQADMADVEGQLFGSGARTLPDGTKVVTRKSPGEKGGAGVVMWTVDTIRPDGRRVVISAFNSGSQHAAATRTAPALTMKQLEAIATSTKWVPQG
jgi:hypothetical protein